MISDESLSTAGAVAKGIAKGVATTIAPRTTSIIGQTKNLLNAPFDDEEKKKREENKKVNELFGRNVL